MAYNNQLVNQQLQGGGNLLSLPTYGNQQGGVDALLAQLRNMGSQGLQNPQQGFGPIEEASRRGFENRTIPLLAERAASMGGRSSSGFQNSLGKAGSDFELGLNAQRAQFGQNNIGNLLQMLQLGLRPTQENIYTPPGQSFGSSLAGGLGQGLGTAGTLYAGNQLGNIFGGTAGKAAESSGGIWDMLKNLIPTGVGAAAETAGPGTLATLASSPYLLPVLAALAAAGGLYAYSQSGD